MDDNLSDNASRPTDTSTPIHEIDSSENVETQSSSLNTEELTKKSHINQSVVWEHFTKVLPAD
jgi:hypothetical protein